MVSKNIIWLTVDSLCCHIHPEYLCCETSTLLTSLLFACVTCMWVYQYVIRLAFNTSFGNQVLCCAWLSTAVYLICACLPHCAVMMSAIGVLRVAWNVNVNWFLSFLFLLYFFAYTIMCAFPMYYVSRTTKTPKQKKTPVERKISLFL